MSSRFAIGISSIIGATLFLGMIAVAADAKPPEPVDPPVTDPVSIGWNLNWVAQRYDMKEKKWRTWRSPATSMPRKAVSVIGVDAAAVVDLMECGWWFDLHQERWREMPEVPLKRAAGHLDAPVVAFVGRKLFAWTITTGGPQGAVFDPDTFKWTPVPDAPVPPRYRANVAVIGSKVFMIHGYGRLKPGHYGPLHDGATFDVSTNKWDKLPDPPKELQHYGKAIAIWKDRLVLVAKPEHTEKGIGGAIYDPASRAWEKLPPEPKGMGCNTACTVVGDQLFVFSGEVGVAGRSRDTPVTAVLDLLSKKWSTATQSPLSPRKLCSTKVVGSKIVVWGGWNSGAGTKPSPFFHDAAIFDVERKTWESIDDLPIDTPYELHPGW